MSRFQIQKGGAARTGHITRSWFAFNLSTGVGRMFPTWRQALAYALHELTVEAIIEERRHAH